MGYEDTTRHYLVRRSEAHAIADERDPWAICCEGRELTACAGRDRAIALASQVARADHEEFGTQTDVLVEDGNSVRTHAAYGSRVRLS